MLRIENLNITHHNTQKNIIHNLSLSLNPNDKLALIGEEGTGKSSLIKALFYRELDYASITFKHLHHGLLAYVSQDAIRQASFHFDAFTDYQLLFTYLTGFDIDESLLFGDFETLSGGELTKLALIKAFLMKPDVLILDEPTNNLDLKSILFLEKLCLDFEGILIFASHDVSFIKNVANKIYHFESIKRRTHHQQTFYNLNYEDFKTQRNNKIEKETRIFESSQKDIEIMKKRHEKIHNKVEHAQAVISRQDPEGAKRLKVKMQAVKSNEKNIERKIEQLKTPDEYETPVSFILQEKDVHNQKLILDLHLKPFMIDEKVLAKEVFLQIIGPEKIAIVGSNGVGKTSLLKEVIKKLKVPYAYMPQNYSDVLDVHQTPIELLANTDKKDSITQVRTYLGSLLFTYEEMNSAFKNLSGGQKAKVYFASMALKEIEVLIFDEPTRNISALSMEILLQEMVEFKGVLILITHDRMLLENAVNKIYELTNKGLFERTYEALYKE